MPISGLHSFHIPVLGIGYSIDTPVKVARFGITSVISIMDDEVIEKMRKYHCEKAGKLYIAITQKEDDYRAMRVTAYLNLISEIINNQVFELKQQLFEPGNDVVKYFEMLPEQSFLKKKYNEMLKLGEGLRGQAHRKS